MVASVRVSSHLNDGYCTYYNLKFVIELRYVVDGFQPLMSEATLGRLSFIVEASILAKGDRHQLTSSFVSRRAIGLEQSSRSCATQPGTD